MKKKIFGGITVLALAAIAAFNINLNVEDGLSFLSLANIEALAGEGVESCDITKYNRNEKEQYVTTNVSAQAGGGFYVSYNGRRITLGAEAKAGGTVGIPDCVSSSGNCCAKSFINNSVKYY